MRIKEERNRISRCIKHAAFAAVMVLLLTGAAVTVNAAGMTITSPAQNAVFEVEKKVTVKIQIPSDSIQYWKKQYVFFRITRINPDNSIDSVMNIEKAEIGPFSTTAEKSFTPDKEGSYVIEAHFNGTASGLAAEDFTADAEITVKVVRDISGAEISGLPDKVFSGQQQMQNIRDFTVTLGEKTLVPETDYVISSYTDNVNAGQATMTIAGQGFYSGTKDVVFNITGKPIPETSVSSFPDVVFSNKSVRPEPTVVVDGTELEKDTDYLVSYGENTNAGTPASVTVTGTGNYSGEVTKTFHILPVSIRKAVIPMINDQKYTGNPVKPYPSVKYNGYGISKDIDFTMTYSNNIEPGTATVIFTGIGNFKDSVTRTFTIKEPTAGGGTNTFSSVILSPSDNTEYPVGTEITVTAKATNFYYNYYTGLAIETNFLYFKVTRDGEEILYKRSTLKPDTVSVSQSFIADVPGVYLIQTEWDDCYVDSTGTYTPIASENFSPDTSIRVYVGRSAPEGGSKDIASATITGITDKPYSGNAITQNPTVKVDGKTLVYGTDYYLTYLNNFNIGPAAVKIHGKGKYTGTTDYMTFHITSCPLSADMINLSAATYIYNGKLQKPAVSVKHGDFTLDEGTDYILENTGGTEPGSFPVKITAVDGSNYTGTAEKTYKINGIPITNAVVTVDPASYVYDGSAKKPAVTVKLNGEPLPAQNYTVSYSNNVNAGTAQAVVTAKAGTHYAGTASGTFTIGKYDIASTGVAVGAIADTTYNRNAQTPVPAVTFGGKTLQNGTDYTLQYSGNTGAGTAEVTIAGKGNFKGSRKQTFTIGKKAISAADITVSEIPKQIFTEGSVSQPAVTVKDGSTVLSAEEITVAYKNNDRPGTASVTITGKGNYTGSRDVPFEILEKKDYTENTLSEKIKEIEEGDTSQYFAEDKKQLQDAVAEAKKILREGKADAGTVEKVLAKVEKAKAQADNNLTNYEKADPQQKKELEAELALPAPASVENAILADKKDRDPAGSGFTALKLRSRMQGKNNIRLTWSSISGASKYIVYGNKCGKKIKKLKTVTKNSYTQKGLKKNTYYKFIVVAVKNTSAGEKAAATSKMIHVATKGGEYGNYKSVTVKIQSGKKKKTVTKVTVKKGKKIRLYAAANPASKKLKVKKHVKIRFESTDPEKAAVSIRGVVTGRTKGTCYVFAYAQNGIYKKIKVTVK